MLGTAAYLSPEQARGDEAGPASDTYSLGVCAYQFLTGRLPHEYTSLTELALKQQHENGRSRSRTSATRCRRELDDAIRLCLEREPGSRYRSALEMAEAIEAGLHGDTTDATRRLALSDADATRRSTTPPRPARCRAPPTSRGPRRVRRADRRRRAAATTAPPGAPPAGAGMATFFALLLVLAAIAAVGVALIASSDNGGGVSPVNDDHVQQQIQELRQFLQDTRALAGDQVGQLPRRPRSRARCRGRSSRRRRRAPGCPAPPHERAARPRCSRPSRPSGG